MTWGPPPPDVRALALAAALEELFARNPPPNNRDKQDEVSIRRAIIRTASKGLPGTVRVMAQLMHVQQDEVEAIIALIYG